MRGAPPSRPEVAGGDVPSIGLSEEPSLMRRDNALFSLGRSSLEAVLLTEACDAPEPVVIRHRGGGVSERFVAHAREQQPPIREAPGRPNVDVARHRKLEDGLSGQVGTQAEEDSLPVLDLAVG